MIRFLLLQNRAGKTRLAKYYVPMDDAEKHATEYDVHKIISGRDPKYTNFIEVTPPLPFSATAPGVDWLNRSACTALLLRRAAYHRAAGRAYAHEPCTC